MPAILVGKKNVLIAITTLGDVMRNIGNYDSGNSDHAEY